MLVCLCMHMQDSFPQLPVFVPLYMNFYNEAGGTGGCFENSV